jgi:hypothetical protein
MPPATPAPAVAECSGAWQTARATAPYPAPEMLAFGSDRIAFSTILGPNSPKEGIWSLSTIDGAEQQIAKDAAFNLWAEKDTLLYTGYRKLFSVPIAGGEPTLLVDFDDGTPNDFSFTQALDESFLYWTSLGHHFVARVPRSGGAVQNLGTPTEDLVMGIASSLDTLVVADDQHGFAIPLPTGTARPLADPGGFFAGVDPSGAYFYRLLPPGNPPVERYELVRAPTGGGAIESVWTPPDNVLPHRIWADGQGGWVISSLATFDDGEHHAGVWFVSASGEARLAACDPVPGFDTASIAARPAFSNDAVYFVADKVHNPPATWSIIKIAR